MRCPRCGVEQDFGTGGCVHCGYTLRRNSGGLSSRLSTTTSPLTSSASLATLRQNATLGGGRYRLISEARVPETQQRQGSAWVASDTKLSNRRVVVREMLVPGEQARGSSADKICYAVAQRLRTLGGQAGLPGVSDFFSEQGAHFIVFPYPEGVSLASLLKRYGGALPEEQVAMYGYQLCSQLSVLANQQPSLVHGSINPETIFIDEEQQVASLTFLPLFKPDPPPSSSGRVSAGYYAPEQVHDELSPSTDLYGLAVTMHHMLTGYDPQSRLALFHPPARRLNPTVTTQMELLLARQLSLSASQRYGSPSEMQKDLQALLEIYPDSSSNEIARPAPNLLQMSSEELHERSRNTLMLNMGVFAAICVLLFLGIILVLLR